MTSNHDQDAFEFRFEGAVDDMHHRTQYGSSPSARVWQTIRAGLPEATTRAETADPRATDVDPAPVSRKTRRMRKESNMDTALNPGMAAPSSRSHRGLFAWAAIALVGLLVASSLFWYVQTPPGNDGNELAWAPNFGTPDGSMEVASPAASPQVYEYGPEYACEVEPLTSDEVYETVLNPSNGYTRLGSTSDISAPTYEESRGAWPSPLESARLFPPKENEAELSENAIDTANMFWNCLMTGNAYQVWAMTSPELIQAEVLLNLPVVRSEEDIRTYIENWGPRRYSAGLGLIWPDLGGIDPAHVGASFNGSAVPEEGHGGILVGGASGTRDISQAMVPLSGPASEQLSNGYLVEISLRLHPDGTWTVIGYNHPNALG